MPDNERLDVLERTMANLAREMLALRAEVRALRGDAAMAGRETSPPVHPASMPLDVAEPNGDVKDVALGARRASFAPDVVQSLSQGPAAVAAAEALSHEASSAERSGASRQAPGSRGLDFEGLIGRYGTLALAALTILMGVGAFLGWAIANGKLGPEVRVLLGALGAAALAAFGWRLRMRNARTFGNVMLALALAVVHVDAWGAGPYLGIIASPAALGAAAIASLALAALALRHGEEPLFAVGVGGALLAPFVTSSGDGDALTLAVYGIVVLGGGAAALGARRWYIGALILGLFSVIYTVAIAEALSGGLGRVSDDLPPLFALFVSAVALVLVAAPLRGRIAQMALLAAAGALYVAVDARSAPWERMVLAGAGAILAAWSVRGTSGYSLSGPIGAVILPAAFFLAACEPLSNAVSLPGSGLAVVWALISLGAATLDGERPRRLHLFMAAMFGGVAIALGLQDDLVRTLALAGYGATLALIMHVRGITALALAAAIWLLVATIGAYELLAARPSYGYTPFLTSASFAAAVASAAWVVFAWAIGERPRDSDWFIKRDPRATARAAGFVLPFLWGREELSRAVSPDMSTFLLILYYATIGVAAILVGRARRISDLRHLGLALAIYAALKVIVQASELSIGLRVGSYLLAGLFMLAVAYWYRSGGEHRLETGDGRLETGESGR